jgi:hypothetical protein
LGNLLSDAANRDSKVAPDHVSETEELMRTCPNCGKRLAERKCKLYCPDPRCGFYLSCADYY